MFLYNHNRSTCGMCTYNTGTYGLCTDNAGTCDMCTDYIGTSGMCADNTGTYGMCTDNTGTRGMCTDNTGTCGMCTDNTGTGGMCTLITLLFDLILVSFYPAFIKEVLACNNSVVELLIMGCRLSCCRIIFGLSLFSLVYVVLEPSVKQLF